MILKFQELVKVEGEDDSFRTTGNFAKYQCTHYDVNRKGRLVLVMDGKTMLAQRHIADAEYVDVFEMNDQGKTVDSFQFKPAEKASNPAIVIDGDLTVTGDLTVKS